MAPPVLPEAAKQNTKEGFEAFTQYWFDVAAHAFESRSSSELRRISADDCKVCTAYIGDIDDVGRSGGWAQGPKSKVSDFHSDMTEDPLSQVVGYFMLNEEASTIFDAEGDIKKSRKGGNNGNAKAVFGSFQGGYWLMRQLGQAP